MPAYIWSCPACGKANAAAAEVCNSCGCPAFATALQIEASLEAPAARQGAIVFERSAANLRSELSAGQFFGPILLFAAGIRPSQFSTSAFTPAIASLFIMGCFFALLSFSVAYWLPFVGSSVAAMASVVSRVLALLCLIAASALTVVRFWRQRSSRGQSEHVV